MCAKYSQPTGDPSEFLYSEQIANSFHNPSIFLPDELYNKYPAHVRIDLLSRAHVRNRKYINFFIYRFVFQHCYGAHAHTHTHTHTHTHNVYYHPFII